MYIARKVIAESGVKFGTSGARGLVTQFTPKVCGAFTAAFINVMREDYIFDKVAIAIDNRPSSEAIAKSCALVLKVLGIQPVYYGVVPTPALALISIEKNIPAIMVTGSHIPFDRNGLKFYRPDGEISKQDEQAILASETTFKNITNGFQLEQSNEASLAYAERYISIFPTNVLSDKRIGVYEHSSAGRELYCKVFRTLGAEVIPLGRSDQFVSIDTEAVAEEDKVQARIWAQKYQLDAIFSTDGDGDRPLIADEHGEWLKGDILGLICSQALGIEALAVPVSCTSAIEQSGYVEAVVRTRIGSPFVIAEFKKLNDKYDKIAGFEANGGYLLGSDIQFKDKPIKALPTRDALLPGLMLLQQSSASSISTVVNSLPKRFTHSDRIKEIATEHSLRLIKKGIDSPKWILEQLDLSGDIGNVDITDGLRLNFTDGRIVHLRPSGNAPELRCYAEGESAEIAEQLVGHVLSKLNLLKFEC